LDGGRRGAVIPECGEEGPGLAGEQSLLLGLVADVKHCGDAAEEKCASDAVVRGFAVRLGTADQNGPRTTLGRRR
jgi:hypothetical protein